MQTRPRLADVRGDEPARGHDDVSFSQKRTETDAPSRARSIALARPWPPVARRGTSPSALVTRRDAGKPGP